MFGNVLEKMNFLVFKREKKIRLFLLDVWMLGYSFQGSCSWRYDHIDFRKKNEKPNKRNNAFAAVKFLLWQRWLFLKCGEYDSIVFMINDVTKYFA